MKASAAGTTPKRGRVTVPDLIRASKIRPAKSGVRALAAAATKLKATMVPSSPRNGLRYLTKIAVPRRIFIFCVAFTIVTRKPHYSSNSRVAAGITAFGLCSDRRISLRQYRGAPSEAPCGGTYLKGTFRRTELQRTEERMV